MEIYYRLAFSAWERIIHCKNCLLCHREKRLAVVTAQEGKEGGLLLLYSLVFIFLNFIISMYSCITRVINELKGQERRHLSVLWVDRGGLQVVLNFPGLFFFSSAMVTIEDQDSQLLSPIHRTETLPELISILALA